MKRESGCKDICIISLYPISSPWFSFQHPVIFIQPIPRILIFLLSFYINKTASIFFFNFHLSILTFCIFLLSRNYLQYVQSLILSISSAYNVHILYSIYCMFCFLTILLVFSKCTLGLSISKFIEFWDARFGYLK
jgi:hypothetical protein